jgi:hypothetical protein
MQSSVIDIVHFQKWIHQTYFKIIEHGFQNLRRKEFFVSVWSVLSTSVNPKFTNLPTKSEEFHSNSLLFLQIIFYW